MLVSELLQTAPERLATVDHQAPLIDAAHSSDRYAVAAPRVVYARDALQLLLDEAEYE